MQTYYERNTSLFLSHGKQGRTRTIHRAVWAPGVADRETALNTSNELVRQELARLAEQAVGEVKAGLRVADLGCGVGGSLFYLARQFPAGLWGVGLTISPRQARLAASYAQGQRLEGQCAFLEADYLNLPLAHGLDVAFSIEAFAHAPDPQEYMHGVARLLRSGGRLLLCDDFRLSQADSIWIAAFQRGWHVPRLCSLDEIEELALSNGMRLVSQRDLTQYLRLSWLPPGLVRPLVAAWMRLRPRHPYWESLFGGIALQQCLKSGDIAYRFLVFEKLA